MEKDLLLLNNKDLNISEYDKGLSYNALQGIISAKRSYENAKNSGDKVGMAKANAYANTIRKQEGGYTGGDDGGAYYPISSFPKKEKPTYTSPYTDKIDDLYNKITNREKFSYDVESDPLYALYKKVYEQFGETASDRAYAQGSFKTGGLENSNAISAATQAESYYKTQLAEKAMDLYKDAYSKYTDEGKDMKDTLDYLSKAEESSYNRYRDELKDYNYDNEINYKIMRDIENDVKEEVRYDSEQAYKKQRDAISDNQKAQDYNLQKDKLAEEISRWEDQDEIDRFNALSKLIQSVYGRSTIGVDVNALRNLLGI